MVRDDDHSVSEESAAEVSDISEAELEAVWEDVPDDPDPIDDLGFDLMELDVLVTSNSDKKVMLLPSNEEQIRDDAYVIADFELTVDPLDMT